MSILPLKNVTEFLGEGRIWKEYLGRHVEKVIKPLKAHARAARAAGHLYFGTSGASIKRLRPTQRRAGRTRWRRTRIEIAELREGGGRVEQIETAMSLVTDRIGPNPAAAFPQDGRKVRHKMHDVIMF